MKRREGEVRKGVGQKTMRISEKFHSEGYAIGV